MAQKQIMVQFENKYNIKDIETPRHEMLSAQYKKSFAYYAVLERLPVMLTVVIDQLTRNKDEIIKAHGEFAREEIKQVIARIAKLKYELQTDKNFLDLENDEPDMELWNKYLADLPKSKKTFFRSCWMDAECYTYRKLHTFFTQTETLRDYDYFKHEKQEIIKKYARSMAIIAKIAASYEKKVECFAQFLQLLTWSRLEELVINENLVIEMEGLEKNSDQAEEMEKDLILYVLLNKMHCILDDATNDVWQCLQTDEQDESVIVDIVLNNAGFDVFICLLLGQFLIDKGLAKTIRFHVKELPWFIYDVTQQDVRWFLEFLQKHESEVLRTLGVTWRTNFEKGTFLMAMPSYFWTTSYPFFRMYEISPDLYNYLRQAKLILFNGDLNYRKLLGDYSWDDTEEFLTCIRGFLPTNICCVRGIRSKVICGMRRIDTDKLHKRNSNWMSSGEYGTIQFAAATYCGCEDDNEPPYPYANESKDNTETCELKFAERNERLQQLTKNSEQEKNKATETTQKPKDDKKS